jgi:hypothetical protein
MMRLRYVVCHYAFFLYLTLCIGSGVDYCLSYHLSTHQGYEPHMGDVSYVADKS